MENSEIPGRIQMERFIPVESFRKKINGFRGYTVVPFLPKRPKFLVPFVWISRLHVERKRKIDRYFVNGTIQSRSCFRCQMFHRNFRTNGKCSWCLGFELAISRSTDRRLSNWATNTMPDFISETLNFSERYLHQQKTNLVPRSRRLRRQGIWVRDHEKKGVSWEDKVNTSDVFLFHARLKLLGTPCLQFPVRSSCSSSYYKWGRVILVSIVPRSWTLGSIVSGMGDAGGWGGGLFPPFLSAPLHRRYTL